MFRLSAMALALTLISAAAWAQQEVKACDDRISARVIVGPAQGAGSSGFLYRLWIRYSPARSPTTLAMTVRFTGTDGVTVVSPGIWTPTVHYEGAHTTLDIARAPMTYPFRHPPPDQVLRSVQITCP